MGRVSAQTVKPGGAATFNHLVALAEDRSVKGRSALASSVGGLTLASAPDMSSDESRMVDEIIQHILRDAEAAVRRALADRLAREPDAPADLVRKLARDEITVAEPVLRWSPVLDDPTLIELARHAGLRHRLTIAARPKLSAAVVDVLVENNEEPVILAVLSNAGAELNDTAARSIAEAARDRPSYQGPLVARDDLPPSVVKSLVTWIAAALRDELVDRYGVDLSSGGLEDALADPADLLKTRPTEGLEDWARQVVDTLEEHDLLTARTALDLLKEGEVEVFEVSLARLAGLSLTLCRRVLYDSGLDCLAVACRGAGFDGADFAALVVLIQPSNPLRKGETLADRQRALRYFQETDNDAIDRVMLAWRRTTTPIPPSQVPA